MPAQVILPGIMITQAGGSTGGSGSGSVTIGPDYGGVSGDQMGVVCAVALDTAEITSPDLGVIADVSLNTLESTIDGPGIGVGITSLAYAVVRNPGATAATNDGPDNWTNPTNAQDRNNATNATRVGQLAATTAAPLHFTFPAAAASTTPDSSGNSRTGTLSGQAWPTPVTSPLAGMSFDGVDRNDDSSGVNCGATGVGCATADGSMRLLATIRRSRTGAGVVEIIAGKSDNATAGKLNYLLYVNADKLNFYVMNSVGTSINAVGTTTLASGTDYAVEGEWTGSVVRVKVNSVQEGTTPAITALTAPDGVTPFYIGRDANVAGTGGEPFPFQGTISAVQLIVGGATKGNWALTTATNFGGFAISAATLDFYSAQTGTALANGNLIHEWRIGTTGAWTVLETFTGDVTNNPKSYNIFSTIGANGWGYVVEARVRTALAVATNLVNQTSDAVQLVYTAAKTITPTTANEIVVNQGLGYIADHAAVNNGLFFNCMAVDDGATAFVAGDTSCNSPTNFTSVAFDSTPTRSVQTISHVATFGTGAANFTIKRISLHQGTGGSISGSTADLYAGVSNESLVKNSNYALIITMKVTYTSIP